MHLIHRISRNLIAATLLVASSMAFAQGALDGRRFDSKLGVVGKPEHVPRDILTFAGGLFHSSDCDQYGYNKSRYQTAAQGDGTSFETETVSEEYGRNVWKGVVRGNTIEGTMVFYRKPTWWRPSPEPIEHWFRGQAM